MKKIVVNMASESDISVQGHGVHTAYEELLHALGSRDDVDVIRGEFKRKVDCDVYHLHSIGSKMWPKIFDKSAKTVVSAHVIPDSFVGSLVLAQYWRFLAVWYMRWFYNKADKVLAVSNMVAESLHDELRVPKYKIDVLHNTIDMNKYKTDSDDHYEAREALKISPEKFVVVGVGQVQPRKRIDVFFDMAREMPEAEFIWVGGIPFGQLGADYKSMQKMIDSVPGNIRITGVIPHEEVKLYLQAADVFCLPAEQENHPMCVLEAAGVGLPIVLRDMPEYNDTFKQDALRCARDEDFTAAVKLLQKDKSALESWSEKSANIAKRFDSAAAADRLMMIYRELTEE